ncbi:Protein of unknown function [Saccharicrinis carchari]|uniref:DUF4231 domain-containing protein n=1 Tax=Saccharicrinis carchari TaxID=1168039 RepID=A0A521EDN5_SACCC|nr:DUF4231 domain-containing protein [Saccharicrinis carchari]SMO81942.1 Protein of unknown function [Saccharicrinis carchari]
MRKLYKKRPKYFVTAVQLDLNFERIEYEKWGGKQKCKPGDWLINNSGDTYTVDKKYFIDNYQRVSPGVYNKIGEIWAEVATEDGSIKTLEGSTDYKAGDYLIFDREEGGDGYAIQKQVFERMYEEINPTTTLTREQESYINNRIQPRIDDFKNKANKNRNRFYVFQAIAILSAALVPVFSGFISDDTDPLKWLVAILGGTSAIVAGLLALYKFQENWIRYRSTYHDLESILAQFKTCSGIYVDSKQAFTLLLDNCERILKAEIGQWAESRRKKDSEDDG